VLTSLVNSVTSCCRPLFAGCAWLLGILYAVVPDYAATIGVLTVAVSIAVFPFAASTLRSSQRLQAIAPQLRRLRERHRPDPGAPPEERARLRRRLDEETLALYRQNGVSPAGGCLPALLQLPIFSVLYETIRGLTHLTPSRRAAPLYLSPASTMYRHIVAAHGAMRSLGVNLADSVRTGGLPWSARLLLLALVVVAVLVQRAQGALTRRRGKSSVVSLEDRLQRAVPLVCGLVYLALPGALTLYLVASGSVRILEQWFVLRSDRMVTQAPRPRPEREAPACRADRRNATRG
jgi:YidC/Oxa1 family membrane protein insertase